MKKHPESTAHTKTVAVFSALAIAVLLSFVLGLRFGSVSLSNTEFWGALLQKEGSATNAVILWSVRLPRVLAGLLAGVGLAVSGVLLQGVTDNALASPNLIGVNAGAGLAVALLLFFFPALYTALPFSAFLGALSATLLILLLAGKTGNSRASILLAGIAMTALCNAGISALTMLDSDLLATYNAFSIGGFRGIMLRQLPIPALILAASLTLSLILAKRLDLLCLGDYGARALGIRVFPVRILCIVCASASAAAVVSFAGLLGFVGLIVPHMARKLVGSRTAPLLVASALLGAALTTLADLLGRVLFAPSELPVGIAMALLGVPFFILLLLRERGKY